MKIGLLVIGSEVLNGKVGDTNTKALADFLKLKHLEIFESMTVRDDEKAIHKGLSLLMNDCDVVVTSGGLGPTRDDITKQTIASFLGRTISYSADAEKIAAANYQKFDRPFPGKDHGYCYLPEGFVALNNSNGFAPNLYTKHGNKILVCGPGVPREFKAMLNDHFIKLVSEKLDKNSYLETVLVRTKKIPEEKIFGEVDPELWNKLEKIGEVSSLPIVFGVDIGVKIHAGSQSELDQKREQVLKVFDKSPLKPAIWHVGYELLDEVIVQTANKKQITYGFAESATGGLCSNLVTNISGSSKTFMGSVVCYDEKVKENILGVNPKTITEKGVVSVECAKEMALGLKKALGVDIAIAITGYAGPTGGTAEYPVGSVCIGVADKNQVSAECFHFKGDREILKTRFSQAALHQLLETLKQG